MKSTLYIFRHDGRQEGGGIKAWVIQIEMAWNGLTTRKILTQRGVVCNKIEALAVEKIDNIFVVLSDRI
jgi:hypothetical protein